MSKCLDRIFDLLRGVDGLELLGAAHAEIDQVIVEVLPRPLAGIPPSGPGEPDDGLAPGLPCLGQPFAELEWSPAIVGRLGELLQDRSHRVVDRSMNGVPLTCRENAIGQKEKGPVAFGSLAELLALPENSESVFKWLPAVLKRCS